MKPFITDALVDGKYVLPFQIEGVDRKTFIKFVHGKSVLGYSLPKDQMLKAAWDFCLFLDDDISISFSSATTGIGDWAEMGSLNINVCAIPDSNALRYADKYVSKNLSLCVIKRVDQLVFRDEKVYSECGLVLCDGDGDEIIVAAGVSPGSVSVSLPSDKTQFEPELDIGDYIRIEFRAA